MNSNVKFVIIKSKIDKEVINVIVEQQINILYVQLAIIIMVPQIMYRVAITQKMQIS